MPMEARYWSTFQWLQLVWQPSRRQALCPTGCLFLKFLFYMFNNLLFIVTWAELKVKMSVYELLLRLCIICPFFTLSNQCSACQWSLQQFLIRLSINCMCANCMDFRQPFFQETFTCLMAYAVNWICIFWFAAGEISVFISWMKVSTRCLQTLPGLKVRSLTWCVF